jgi:pyruvate dehydrogenase E1 component beta subunit
MMVLRSLDAATRLADAGISVEVIDLRTLVPLDKETIFASVAKTNRLVIVDEAYASCGVSAEVAALVAGEAFDELDAPILRICARPTPHSFSPSTDSYLVPSVERIVSEISDLVGNKI